MRSSREMPFVQMISLVISDLSSFIISEQKNIVQRQIQAVRKDSKHSCGVELWVRVPRYQALHK